MTRAFKKVVAVELSEESVQALNRSMTQVPEGAVLVRRCL